MKLAERVRKPWAKESHLWVERFLARRRKEKVLRRDRIGREW